ncbi:hypothetical protein KR009_005532 [Drosophila setifemur]|nr:hypothetical protein KR009_005532 [Drosophila setifemur]
MVICSAAMPPETRQQSKQVKAHPGLIDDPLDLGEEGGGGENGAGKATTLDDDREEGEVVDDFEMIISSEDEEFKLRARIQQLEENNKDVERMDMLSANQYNYSKPVERIPRYHQHKSPIYVLSDVSSQSEGELEIQRKYRKHKVRRLELGRRNDPHMNSDTRRNPLSRRYKRQHSSPPRRRQAYHSYQPSPHQQRHFNQQHFNHSSPRDHQDSILLDSLDSVTEDELNEYDVNDENEDVLDLERLKLSRDKLRLALALEERNDMMGQYKHSLRERLQCRLRKTPSRKFRRDYPEENELPLPPLQQLSYGEEEEPEQEQPQGEDPAELKLRLIALKSAILKKHLARKKRDAERAYSPTDMINRVHPANPNHDDDIDDLMEISPAASPERIQSPPRFAIDDAVDTKPVDMDLADTDSDEQHKDGWNSWPNNWNSLDNAGGRWRCFVPNSLPPVSMPIVIDEEEEEEVDIKQGDRCRLVNAFVDDEPPPPPPFHIPHMHLEDEDARDAMHLVEQHSNHSSLTDMQSVSMENSQTRHKSQLESSDDEAGALRAMLLSNLRSIRAPPPPPAGTPPPLSPPPSNAAQTAAVAQLQEESNQAVDSDDPEELRSLLLSSIATKKQVKSSSGLSPEILKNAVRRFQSSGLPMKEEDQLQEQAEELLEEQSQSEKLKIKDEEQQPIQEEATEPSAALEIPKETIEEPLTASPPAIAVGATPPPPVAIPTKKQTSPSTKIIKIVKPNKVINKKTTTKRKLAVDESSTSALTIKRPTTLMIKEPSAPLHGRTAIPSSTRLITTVDPASIKVKKLVISLGEESPASDDELELSSCFAYSSYGDIASPLSLAMGSASGSTTRSNTPIAEIVEAAAAPSGNSNLRRTVINEYFEKKIDDFLKQARSNAPATSSPEAPAEKVPEIPKVSVKQPIVGAPKTQQAKTTPVAVRHLPVASQKEYLRLVERMQMLEKKKVKAAKGSGAAVTSKPVTAPNPPKVVPEQTKATSVESTQNTPPAAKATKANSKPSQPPKESRLKAFENSFAKIGGSMIANLDKSLQMVEEAKKSKEIRLRCSQRLKELYAEMLTVKQAVKQEEQRLARIQPEIQASHEIIISLKQKRHKLHTAAMDLGRGLRGDDYRLIDGNKAYITRKSTQLTKEIRLYNSIVKFDDLRKLTDEESSHPSTVIAREEHVAPEQEQQQEKSLPDEPAVLETTQPCTEPEKATPDNQAQDPVRDAAPPGPPYTVSTMRELREEEPQDGLRPSKYLRAYQTPMSRNYNSQIDVHATICPFDLMGRCEDADCFYLHLARPDGQSELPKTSPSLNN